MCIRYFRGVYQYENVLSMKERTLIWRLLERKKKFGQKLAKDERMFDYRPPYISMPAKIIDILVDARKEIS